MVWFALMIEVNSVDKKVGSVGSSLLLRKKCSFSGQVPSAVSTMKLRMIAVMTATVEGEEGANPAHICRGR